MRYARSDKGTQGLTTQPHVVTYSSLATALAPEW